MKLPEFRREGGVDGEGLPFPRDGRLEPFVEVFAFRSDSLEVEMGFAVCRPLQIERQPVGDAGKLLLRNRQEQEVHFADSRLLHVARVDENSAGNQPGMDSGDPPLVRFRGDSCGDSSGGGMQLFLIGKFFDR